MSMTLRVYLGPFAEWLVPKAKYKEVSKKWSALVEELQESKEGCLEFDAYRLDEVVVGRKHFIRECWTAYFGLSDQATPPRKFEWVDSTDLGVWEFPGFDPEQEKHWFRQTFGEQLRRLTDAYGWEPSIKWGVVTRLS